MPSLLGLLETDSPEVIHRQYHGCVDGHEEATNAKITKALEEDGDMT